MVPCWPLPSLFGAILWIYVSGPSPRLYSPQQGLPIKLTSQRFGCAFFLRWQSTTVKLMWEYETLKANVNKMKTHDGHLPYVLADGKSGEQYGSQSQPGSSTRVYLFPLYELNEVKLNLKAGLENKQQNGVQQVLFQS